MPNLSIHLLTWNGVKYIPYLFNSLRKQTFKDFRLLIADSGSKDGTVETIERKLKGDWCQYDIHRLEKNLGFAGGHDWLWQRANGCKSLVQACSLNQKSSCQHGETDEVQSKRLNQRATDRPNYILLLNQDTYLMPDYVEKLVEFMDSHSEAGAASGRLMRFGIDSNRLPDDLDRLNIVDAVGLKKYRNGRVVEWLAGIDWNQITTNKQINYLTNNFVEVFGVSGAAPMYRAAAMDQVGFFDPDFFSYKEDVDLSYRLRRAGWKSYCVTDAVAYHDRSAALPGKDTRLALAANRKNKSYTANYYSYRNHLITLFKNISWQDFLRDGVFILWYELQKAVYFFFLEPRVFWKSWLDIFRNSAKIREKRKKYV